MRQLNFIETGKLEWRETPDPQLEADREAIVEPVAVATCDLDALIVHGAVPLRGPFPFGHEGVGRVLDVGDAVKDVVPGDLVSIPFQISCGSCEQCKRGRSGHCQAVPRLSMYGLGALSGGEFGGFLSDRVRVPFADHMLVALPRAVAPESVASLSDNIVNAWRTVGPQLEQEPGAEVLVVSAENSISLYAAAIAGALDAGRVNFIGGGPRQWEIAGAVGRERDRGRHSRAARAVSNHGQRQRQPRRAVLRASFDQPRRRLHQRGHLLRCDDPGAAL